ncbi:MAG: hypothetical protein INQ03_17755 [Candidatus Heimdallarchaeota archaeon]|nr:hypothetical protein [Candidatus Heimdallarchaeota archaeon]
MNSQPIKESTRNILRIASGLMVLAFVLPAIKVSFWNIYFFDFLNLFGLLIFVAAPSLCWAAASGNKSTRLSRLYALSSIIPLLVVSIINYVTMEDLTGGSDYYPVEIGFGQKVLFFSILIVIIGSVETWKTLEKSEKSSQVGIQRKLY